MKKTFSFLLIIINCSLAFSQQPSWVYKVSYNATTEHADSVNIYTKVFMDINPAALLDSATLELSISSTAGLNDIYFRSIVNSSDMVNGNDITMADGAIRFYMGKFVILPTRPFIVDLAIKPKGTVSQ